MFFTRDRAEKVVEYHHFPEWSFITRRPRLAWHYRFWTGRPLDGVRWTNSTFLNPGSRGEASWWLRLAGWQRLVLRLLMVWAAVMALTISVLVLLRADTVLLKLVMLHVLLAAPVLLLLDLLQIRSYGLRAPVLTRELVELTEEQERELAGADAPERLVLRVLQVLEGRREWEREVVEPLAMALAESLDNVFRPGDTDWIHVPRNYLEPGGGKVEILLPTGFSGSMNAKKMVLEKAIANKLGMIDPMFEWQVQGRRPRYALFRSARQARRQTTGTRASWQRCAWPRPWRQWRHLRTRRPHRCGCRAGTEPGWRRRNA